MWTPPPKIATGLLAFAAGRVALRSHLLKRAESERADRQQRLDQYSSFIEQLGHDHLVVRVGALFTLEQLIWDHPEEYAAPGYEVLISYVQTHARVAREKGWDDERYEAERKTFRWGVDLEAAWNILTRQRELFDEHVEALLQADDVPRPLSGTAGISMPIGPHLVAVDLTDLCLNGRQFDGATLTGCRVDKATLTDCRFLGATLTDSRFEGAEWSGVVWPEGFPPPASEVTEGPVYYLG